MSGKVDVNDELSNLYGAAWFYASYYLLLKSESRESDTGTHYFYKGGKEAAELYNIVGWDFYKSDAMIKAGYARERARCVSAKDKACYDAVVSSEAVYEKEKLITANAVKLGKILGAEEYYGAIRGFVLSCERTEWFNKYREETVEDEAFRTVLSKRFLADPRDVVRLTELEGRDGIPVSVAFAPDMQPEPARFIGVDMFGDEKFYLLEHLRENGSPWSGYKSVMGNLWDSAKHDGCLETVSVPPEDAAGLYVGLNSQATFMQGHFAARCALWDATRKLSAFVRGNRYSLSDGKSRIPYVNVVERYKARNVRLFPERVEADKKNLQTARMEIMAKDDSAADKIRALGDDGLARIENMVGAEIQKRRREIMKNYYVFDRGKVKTGRVDGRIPVSDIGSPSRQLGAWQYPDRDRQPKKEL